MKSGVYSITNTVNGKQYVGSSINVYNRFYAHRNKLRRNVHSNRHLNNAYLKYGEDKFVFKVLEYCDDYTDTENYYIMLFSPVYNKRMQAQNNKGLEVSKITRKKISDTLKKHYKEGLKAYAQQHLQKEVYKYSLVGELLSVYRNSTEAAQCSGLGRDSIRRACVRKFLKYGGFQWRFKEDLPTTQEYRKTGVPVLCVCMKTYNNQSFNSIRDCARHFNVTSKVIKRAIDNDLVFRDHKISSPV